MGIPNAVNLSENLKKAYDVDYNDGVSEWRDLNAKYKAQNIIDVCQGKVFNKILEIGCGDGAIISWLEKMNFGKEYYGLEISESGRKEAENRGIKNLKEIKIFDGYDMPYGENEFDLVILSHVIEHVEYPRILLRNMKKLAPYHVFEIPIDFLYDVDRHVDHFLGYGHINIYTPSLFRFLLDTEGYDLVKDKKSVMAKEIIEIMWYNNMKLPKNITNKLKLKWKLIKRSLQFMYHKEYRKEIMSDAYTVLYKTSDRELNIL